MSEDDCFVPKDKTRKYLLDLKHEDGGPKAKFLIGTCGFTEDQADELEEALKAHYRQNPKVLIERNEYGQKLQVVGPFTGPNDRVVLLESYWIVLDGEKVPSFVTAYPA